ncbi:MAG TPA: peptide chain release factor N(5)-glutamine methyltransferase [Gemmatimonadota bacterium]|nr:peptide chain release factor N(5)-glutamine methyltransferase [Gemmatimonadota bacterium]
MTCAVNLSPSRSDSPTADEGLDVAAALEAGRRTLLTRSGDDARREALFLLAGVLQITPGAVALERRRPLTATQRAEYEARLARRAQGEPLQYIEGHAAFRQLNLRVDPSVLIPRPETELLVECVLERCRGRQGLRALDLGTGSGAIALSLACEGNFEFLVGVDISPAALNLARYNATDAGVEGRVDWRAGSLYSALQSGERFDVIVSNPPYIANGEAESLPSEVRDWEPAVALFAGPSGVEVIEEIVSGAPRHLEPGGLLALEVAPGVAEATLKLIRGSGSFEEPELLTDLAGTPRIVLAAPEH